MLSRTPWTLLDVIAFLSTKDPEESYDWTNCFGECLWGQYAQHIHGKGNHAGTLKARIEFGGTISLGIAKTEPWTFGAALARAKALQESS